jgi:hypothetical protein
MRFTFALALLAIGCGPPDLAPPGTMDMAPMLPPWLTEARILVKGDGVMNMDCRPGICQHNENTDMIVWKGATWLVHRTAKSQVLGDDSSLHIYKTTDGGVTFADVANILAPDKPLAMGDPMGGRDLRDPCFYIVGDQLFIKALTRLPVTSTRDSFVNTVAVYSSSSDGVTWSPLAAIGPVGWSYWRIKEWAGTYYTAAYQDGDLSIAMFSSKDGINWTRGADVYTVAADTPVETELTFMPSGTMLALVRMDGTDAELLGASGRLRTKICWASPPDYAKFDCSAEFDGQRLDGPLTFFAGQRLFVVARKHLPTGDRKRTSLFEIAGTLDGGPITIKEWGELPSAGDTSYAGAAPLDDHRFLVSWYSGALDLDENWVLGILDATDIWMGTIDISKLQ